MNIFAADAFGAKRAYRRMTKNTNAILKYQAHLSTLTEPARFYLNHARQIETAGQRALEELHRRRRDLSLSEPVRAWARELAGDGRNYVTEEQIFQSLSVCDEKYMLKAAEIIDSPRAALNEIFICMAELSSEVEKLEYWRYRAEIWMSEARDIKPQYVSPSFYEYALSLSNENGDAEKRERLLKRLSFIGRTEEDAVKLSANDESDLLLRLKNLVSLMYTLLNLRTDELFARVSFTERLLIGDPGNLYAQMDEASRQRILYELERLSAKTHIPERLIASKAIQLAKEENYASVCEVLYTDSGRERLFAELKTPLPVCMRIRPDPDGKGLIILHLVLSAVISCFSAALLNGWLSIIVFPAVWAFSGRMLKRVLSRLTEARPLLRLKIDRTPEDARTLVMIPALIPSYERGREIMRQLEAFGINETDANIDYLLLGDFPDAAHKTAEKDYEVIRGVKSVQREINARAGRKKYFYLHRERCFYEKEQVWMGRERKRGAIEDLNRLIQTGENRFHAEGTDAEEFFGKYKYVLTLDADTQMLPDTVKKLIGAIHHPFNRDIHVIQPRMELSPERSASVFARLFAGAGGSDLYNACGADIYQDLTGNGIYSGKGIYRVEAFYEKTNEAFCENTVLSHDMIEGILAGAAYAGDIVLFEGFPGSVSAYLKRLERWTRGDWQLLYYAFGRLSLKAVDRYKIFDNQLRSLSDLSVFILTAVSMLTGRISCLLWAMVLFLLPEAFSFRSLSKAFLRLGLLSETAFTCAAACIRGLYRTYVSKIHRLSWVTAEEAERAHAGRSRYGIIAFLFMLPGLFRLTTLLPAMLLSAGFLLTEPILKALSRAEEASDEFTLHEYNYLSGIARDTWKYFEKYVPLGRYTLPPDNVQLDPPKGEAFRTSPTNIGMYILSVIGAEKLGLIERSEMRARLREITAAVQRLEKWHGLLFNWYDTKTLKPLSPRYVSSVDCGNLMAACVCARNALYADDSALSERYAKMIRDMQLERLYDEGRRLFRIGYDAEKGIMSRSYYDLLSSEARILCYTAISEKGIEPRLWRALSRPYTSAGRKGALVSWSGTMFEYMMPFLLMPSEKGTLLYNTAVSVAEVQKKHSHSGIWGVSESGFMAFDFDMNYQYKAFGIPCISSSESEFKRVYSPYSAMLGMMFSKPDAVTNLKRMEEKGLRGEFGFYEAIDFTASESGEIVYSFMTHHQGMAFCALVNLLTGNALQRVFMKDAHEQSASMLLNEKAFVKPARRPGFSKDNKQVIENTVRTAIPERSFMRNGGAEGTDGHVLFTEGASAYFRSDGCSFLKRNGVLANAWHFYPDRYNERLLPRVFDGAQELLVKSVVFDLGYAQYELSNENAACRVSFAISPENCGLYAKLLISNRTDGEKEISVKQSFKLCMTHEDGVFAHPVFSDLFIKSDTEEENGILHERIQRSGEEKKIWVLHKSNGIGSIEKCARRQKKAVSEITGNVRLKAFEKKEAYFYLGIFFDEPESTKVILNEAEFRKAAILSRAQNRTVLGHLSMLPGDYKAADRFSRRVYEAEVHEGENGVRPDCVWPLGLSGEKSVICIQARGKEDLATVRKMLKIHRYMRISGMPCALIMLLPRETEYFAPVRTEVESAVAAAASAQERAGENGIFMIERDILNKEQEALLESLSVCDLKGGSIREQRSAKHKAHLLSAPNAGGISRNPKLLNENAYGGFEENGGYRIFVSGKLHPSLAWANILANRTFGAFVTDRGIASIYAGNSRNCRLTPFDNDPADEKATVLLVAKNREEQYCLFPGYEPEGAYQILHSPGMTEYSCKGEKFGFTVRLFVPPEGNWLMLRTKIDSLSEEAKEITLSAQVDFLMGTDTRDRRYLRLSEKDGFIFARGRADGYGYAGFETESKAKNGCLSTTVYLKPYESAERRFVIGFSRAHAEQPVYAFSNDAENMLPMLLRKIDFDTGAPQRDVFLNGFMKYQTFASRLYAKASLLQPGGAVGFRDQLQDMLSVMYFDPNYAREHILLCAAHQFPEGDAMHWWHAPAAGVRTRISDDVLFLAYVTGKYITLTGDRAILWEEAAYLIGREIPEDRDDLYFEADLTKETEPLYRHILRAFDRVYKTGEHGLILMGSGDWNDGMNRIGKNGRGESVWLSEFMLCSIDAFLPFALDEDAKKLEDRKEALQKSIEASAWDGEWYLRAYNDFGEKVGSREKKECRIDLISQCWAVIAGLDEERSRIAFRSAVRELVDFESGIIRLLTPPFTGLERNPGYISAYPPGIRENGGQYTHAAAWLVKAAAKLGFASLSWKLFDMLLPVERSDTNEKCIYYESEPYVVCADISGDEIHPGKGGWTWYTGAAAWCFSVLIEDLLGVIIEENRFRMSALLPEGADRASVVLRIGKSEYTMISERSVQATPLPVILEDDGKNHVYRFPAREETEAMRLRQ